MVHVYPDGKAFEVEFTTLDGKTASRHRRNTRSSAGHQSRDHAFSRADAHQLIRREPGNRLWNGLADVVKSADFVVTPEIQRFVTKLVRP